MQHEIELLFLSMAAQVLSPPKVVSDLTEVTKIKSQNPDLQVRHEAYRNLLTPESEFWNIQNQKEVDSFPREKVLSLYLQAYDTAAAEDWVNTLLRYFPEKTELVNLVSDHRNQKLDEQLLLMLTLETPHLTNDEIFVVGW